MFYYIVLQDLTLFIYTGWATKANGDIAPLIANALVRIEVVASGNVSGAVGAFNAVSGHLSCEPAPIPILQRHVAFRHWPRGASRLSLETRESQRQINIQSFFNFPTSLRPEGLRLVFCLLGA